MTLNPNAGNFSFFNRTAVTMSTQTASCGLADVTGILQRTIMVRPNSSNLHLHL